MTSPNPKYLLKIYKYNNLHLSSTEMNNLTSQTMKPPGELPFEVELPENSPHRKNIPEETSVK